jgi:hypothetical protein
MKRKHFILFLLTILVFTNIVKAQDNPTSDSKKTRKDSAAVNVHSPRKAAIRSAILPGLGQAYNKSYWKIPIVYGALGATAAVFAYNLNNYKDTRFAYQAKYKASLPIPQRDSTDFFNIRPDLTPLSQETLRFYRDQFRRDIDYSVLFFLIAWGLNVVDATVDGHLKSFDVSPDLSLQIKPGHSEMAGTNGLSLVLKIGK